MSTSNILILGGGIAGVAAALAITKLNKLPVSVFEIRSEPSTLGGAVNMTPNALRYLADLGVLSTLASRGCEVPRIELYALRTGKKLTEIDYDDIEKFKYRALRVRRSDLLDALIETLENTGAEIHYGKKAVNISTSDDSVQVSFEDGSHAKGQLLLGCDGIHSFVRTSIVEPDRKPVYSGIANAYALLDVTKLSGKLPFDTTAMYSGRKGSLMMSYYEPTKTKLYASAVMETPEAESREGWKLKGDDRKAVRANILARFAGSPETLLDEVIQGTEDWFLYPVYKLAPRGKWHSRNCLLLGDAAHAMPPQGESIGLALEDVMLFSKILEKHESLPTIEMFKTYESLRRDRIETAFDEANFGWETVKDKGWLGGVMMEYLTIAFIRWKRSEKVKNLAFDVRDLELPE